MEGNLPRLHRDDSVEEEEEEEEVDKKIPQHYYSYNVALDVDDDA